MVEILGQSVPDFPVPIPLGHPFCDSSDYSRPPIPQRNNRQDLSRNDYWRRRPVRSLTSHLDSIVQLLLPSQPTINFNLYYVHIRLTFPPDQPPRPHPATP